MQIRIIETKEVKELIILGVNNMDYSNELLMDHDAIDYNIFTSEWEMKEDDFTWWEEYIDNHNMDMEEIKSLVETYHVDESEINEAIHKEMALNTDLSEEHNIIQEAIKVFKQGKKLYIVCESWKDISIKDKEDLLKSANPIDATTGYTPTESGKCIIDFVGYPLSTIGVFTLSEEENIIIIDEESIIYNS